MVRTSNIKRCLDFLEKPSATKTSAKSSQKSASINFRPRRRMTFNLQQCIVALRYGSLQTFDAVQNSYGVIGSYLNVAATTVQAVLERHKKNGFKIVIKQLPGRQRTEYPSWLSKYLLDDNTLQMWASKSLHARCRFIKVEFDYQTSPSSLSKFYRRNKIIWRRPAFQYRQYIDREAQLQIERDQYALELVQAIMAGKRVIMIDQSTCRTDMLRSRVWSYHDRPLKLPVNKKNFGLTVYGAISTHHEPLFGIYDNTTIVNGLDFINQMKQWANLQLEYIVVLDRHPSHTSKTLVNAFPSTWKLKFMPPASSMLNAIEWVWGVLKQRVRDLLCDEPKELTKESFREMLLDAFRHITRDPGFGSRMVLANRSYLQFCLRRLLE